MSRRTLLSLALAPLAACSLAVCRNHAWSQCSWLGTEPSCEHRTISVDCDPAATGVRSHLRADGSAGELTLRLVDPAGVERHRQVVQGGRCEVTQDWPVQAGTWTLSVEAAGFAGSYSLELSAGDEPLAVRVEIAGDLPR